MQYTKIYFEEMNKQIRSLLGKSYEWDQELFYLGHPLSWNNMTNWERQQFTEAENRISRLPL